MTSNAFLGCQVRRVNSGEAGRIRGMSESGVEIGWEPKTGVIPTEQTFAPGDATFATGIEVYTLDRGWIPAGELPGFNESTEQATMPNEKPAIRSGLSNLLGEIRKALEAAPQALAEKESPHWPFRHTKSRQGGPTRSSTSVATRGRTTGNAPARTTSARARASGTTRGPRSGSASPRRTRSGTTRRTKPGSRLVARSCSALR